MKNLFNQFESFCTKLTDEFITRSWKIDVTVILYRLNCSALTMFLWQEETLHTKHHTDALRNQNWTRRVQIQDKEVQWMWCWRCGGGSVSQRRLCRRTECQQDSPHTLLLYQRRRRRRRRRWLFVSYCDRQSNDHHQSTTDSRTDHWIQTHSLYSLLSFWFFCNSLI